MEGISLPFFLKQTLYFVTFINVVLGLFVLAPNIKSKLNWIFLLMSSSLALWGISVVLLYEHQEIVWAKMTFIAGAIVGWSFLLFTRHFPRDKKISLLIRLLFHLLVIFLIIISQFDLVVIGIYPREWAFTAVLGPLFSVYVSILAIYFMFGFINLSNQSKLASANEKGQITILMVGWIIGVLLTFLTNLLLPTFDIFDGIKFGPFFSLFIILSTLYAISRYSFLNIKVIAAQFLTVFISSILLVEFLLSRNIIEYVLRGLFFVLVGIFGFFLIRSVKREVHQREQLEVLTKQLESANKELARLDQAKSEFLSIASHQLRTPLTAIKGYSSMLLDGTFGPVGGKVKEGVDKVYQSTERMVALVNDLLDTSRLDSGRMVFTFVETDLGEIAKSVCDELVPKAKEKGLSIACAVAQDTPKVFVDQMKIRQILINFIDNAVKYSDTGVVDVKLECRPSTQHTRAELGAGQASPVRNMISNGASSGNNSDNREVIFSVHDNGWGMMPDEMGFLFKKFSRGHGETSHIKGTGLGLYVARRLAEAHGGRVWAESPGKGQGSTFFLALKVGWKPDPSGVYQPKDE